MQSQLPGAHGRGGNNAIKSLSAVLDDEVIAAGCGPSLEGALRPVCRPSTRRPLHRSALETFVYIVDI